MKTRCTSMPAALRCKAIRLPRRSGLRLRGSSHSSVFIAPVQPYRGGERCERKSCQARRTGTVRWFQIKRTTTPPERIFAATRRDGGHFLDLIVPGRYNSPGIRHPPLLHLRKMGSRCSHPVVLINGLGYSRREKKGRMDRNSPACPAG